MAQIFPNTGLILAAGIGGIVSSFITKKEPWKTLGMIGGGITAVVAGLDYLGVLSPLLKGKAYATDYYYPSYKVV